ncbi:glucosidase II beta subunit-like-domain-containing protein [Zopfochytrium polystomum]|nr:glucosidase II beta subunit-like-domain-containing protein [Zopfochytrium polystomum]
MQIALWVAFVATTATAAASSYASSLAGVALADQPKYVPNAGKFTCLDGSGTVSFTAVNDDYCDCKDGSDEPGTSACPNGRFFCLNPGFKSSYIPSSRVGDGVCDLECCDGSDETPGRCPNVCSEQARISREKSSSTLRKTVEGAKKLREFLRDYSFKKAERAARIEELQPLALDAKALFDEKKAAQDEAERKERELENLFNEWKKTNDLKKEHYVLTVLIETIKLDEGSLHFAMTACGDGDRIPQLLNTTLQDYRALLDGKSTLKRERTDTESDSNLWEDGVSKVRPLFEAFLTSVDALAAAKDECTDRRGFAMLEPVFLMGEGTKKRKALLEAVEDKPKTPLEWELEESKDSKHAREEATEAQNDYIAKDGELQRLLEVHNRDMGPNDEMAILLDQCVELDTPEYVYEICFFKMANQKSKNGGSTLIGNWSNWTGKDLTQFSGKNLKYTEAKFDNGLYCWNGPSRSVTVSFECGDDNRLLSVTEPNKCEYAARIETPALCDIDLPDDVADEGHQLLVDSNNSSSQSSPHHDEL